MDRNSSIDGEEFLLDREENFLDDKREVHIHLSCCMAIKILDKLVSSDRIWV